MKILLGNSVPELLLLLVTANFVSSSPVLVNLMMGALLFSGTWFVQEPHGVKSQKTPFFIVTALKTSNLTQVKVLLF
jgi:hypothetical protein